MPVLKQHHNTPALKEAIVLDLGDLGAQATKIRLAAEARATQIINEAQARANQIAEQRGKEAYEQGLANGHEAGMRQGIEEGRAQALAEMQQQLQQVYAAWSDLAQQWEQQRIDMEREARQAVLEFALQATEKLVHRVIEVDDTVIVDQAGQALSMVLSAHDAKIRIHPVDRPVLETALPQLLVEVQTLEHVDLIEDDRVTPGGCVVTFGHGRIDATIERQLERLVDLILPAPVLPEGEDDLADVDTDANTIASSSAADAFGHDEASEVSPLDPDAALAGFDPLDDPQAFVDEDDDLTPPAPQA